MMLTHLGCVIASERCCAKNKPRFEKEKVEYCSSDLQRETRSELTRGKPGPAQESNAGEVQQGVTSKLRALEDRWNNTRMGRGLGRGDDRRCSHQDGLLAMKAYEETVVRRPFRSRLPAETSTGWRESPAQTAQCDVMDSHEQTALVHRRIVCQCHLALFRRVPCEVGSICPSRLHRFGPDSQTYRSTITAKYAPYEGHSPSQHHRVSRCARAIQSIV
ncbi:hypothetical protein C8Q73DRAFT_200353 [Cubamyces lactineus]|nr:hypothetical protein C8Q73DRAFT_200353 [Cubamyces lactineus]